MTDIHRALYGFWSRFGVPAYLSGHVPDGAEFPYITFEVVGEGALGVNYLTAFDWHKAESGVNVNMERASLMGIIADEIPEGGTILPIGGGGYLALFRNNAGFQSYYDDPEDATVIGGRTSYQVNYYMM